MQIAMTLLLLASSIWYALHLVRGPCEERCGHFEKSLPGSR